MENKILSGIEIKALDNGIIAAYAAVYNVVDRLKDFIHNGAAAKSLLERKDRITVLANHFPYDVIGDLKEAREDENGLYIEAKAKENDFAQSWYDRIKLGEVSNMSIGYKAIKTHLENGVRHITELKLFEVSILDIPNANPHAQIIDVKSLTTNLLKNKNLSNSDILAIEWLISQAETKSLDPNKQKLIEIAEFYKLIKI